MLFAVRDAVRNAGLGCSAKTCEVRPDGQPPPDAADEFVAVHQTGSRSTMDNALNEYWDFGLTVTRRVANVPFDRIGDKLLAKALARSPGPGGEPSFNARAEQLRALLHMSWGVLQDANSLMVAWSPDATIVHGFCEPARFRGMDAPALKGGEWFFADPESEDVALTATLSFEGARRLCPIAEYL